MTRIERLPSVVEHGLLPDNVCRQQQITGVEIGYDHIKRRRARRVVPCGGRGTLADYVPFYFAPRSPMLYAITRGQVSAEAARTDQIVYLVSSTQSLRRAGLTVVASNRHAELDYAELSDLDGDLDHDGFVDWPLDDEGAAATSLDLAQVGEHPDDLKWLRGRHVEVPALGGDVPNAFRREGDQRSPPSPCLPGPAVAEKPGHRSVERLACHSGERARLAARGQPLPRKGFAALPTPRRRVVWPHPLLAQHTPHRLGHP